MPRPEFIVCASCEGLNVNTTRIMHSFEYGHGSDAVTLECEVPLCVCGTCKFEFLDDEAEVAQHETLCRHLGAPTPAEIVGNYSDTVA